MANNPAIVDAVLAGAGGGAQISILASSNPATYAQFSAAANVIAQAVDAGIAPMTPGPSLSQLNLLQSITAAVFQGRVSSSLSSSSYTDVAAKIVVLYNQLAALLSNVPNVYPVGNPVIGGTFANRPAAGIAGRLYICSDFPFQYLDTGAAWIQMVGSQQTIAPEPVASFTPTNIDTMTLTQYASSLLVAANPTIIPGSSQLQYYKRGALSVGVGGVWTATIGITGLDLSTTPKSLGLVFDNGAGNDYTSIHVFRNNVLWGIGQYAYNNGMDAGALAATSDVNNNFFAQPRDVYWIRVKFDGALFTLQGAYNTSDWFTVATNADLSKLMTTGSECTTAVNWGFGVATDYGLVNQCSPLRGVVCHLSQTPTA